LVHDDELAALEVDHVLDGGDLDCGSGLVLLIRENMLRVPEGGVLEMRSVEPTVRDDLPPWCRMVGHEFLGALPGASPQQWRYFVRRGGRAEAAEEAAALAADKERARAYEWRLRARASGHLKTTVYCRNFQWDLGQPASFEQRDAHPSAVEAALGALAADLVTGFATACSRAGVAVDDLELTARGRLHDVMAHLGLSDGDPGFAAIEVKLFASSFADEARLRAVWDETLRRSPLAATLARATALTATLSIV
jgi:TusA-related sulfurtransferase